MTLALLLSLACSSPERPVEAPASPQRTVDCAGGGDHTSLDDAIDAASDGEVIEVLPCTYNEQLTFGHRSVTLRAAGGPATAIVDAGGNGPVVSVTDGQNIGTAIIGLTLTGGVEDGSGAAVVADLARLRLENVVITGNTGGTIVNGYGATIQMRDVTITGNTVDPAGDVINLYRGALDASGLTLACDGGDYGIYLGHNSGLVDHGTLTCPGETAVFYEHATGRLQRSRVEGLVEVVQEDGNDEDVVIFENDVFLGGAGITVFENNVVVRNSVVSGGIRLASVLGATIEGNVFHDAACAIDADAATSPFTPSYNDFWNITESCQGVVFSGSDGNLAVNPLFTDPVNGLFTLRAGSPAIDAGLPDVQDPDGTRSDMGAYGGPKTLAGGW